MDIGKEEEIGTIEPIEEPGKRPVPEREPEPVKVPVKPREKEPAHA